MVKYRHMQPENQTPVNYLDQIAPKPEKRDFGNLKFFAVVGSVLAVIVLLLMYLTADKPLPLPTLALRLGYTLEAADKAKKSIKSNDLHSINSNFITFLNVANRDLEKELVRLDVNMKKVDKKILAKENGSELFAALEDARLNATFDRVYPREMDSQLTSMRNVMAEIYEGTDSKKLKEYLNKTDDQMQVIQDQFKEFSASN